MGPSSILYTLIMSHCPQVLQRSVDRELNLYSDPKERTNKVAQVMVLSLSSQPVDHEENGRVKLRPGEAGGLMEPMSKHWNRENIFDYLL